ncbi:hypothetical protein [Phenylobacterium sp.]|uniref:hypothetical protein n=1 Tax=Phenylobacterium sp. TaxID=1871053 RepID=UPI0011FB7C9A|nr:hypothetical protein [Phenylobacterium sp.]THD57677.1 MAG: hypothetical protein E8A12_13160 [Phenylobacterium sp.]
MVLEEIDANLDALAKAHPTVKVIRLGDGVVPVFIAEMIARGEVLPMDGTPTSYAGIPVEVSAIDPTGVAIESEPSD